MPARRHFGGISPLMGPPTSLSTSIPASRLFNSYQLNKPYKLNQLKERPSSFISHLPDLLASLLHSLPASQLLPLNFEPRTLILYPLFTIQALTPSVLAFQPPDLFPHLLPNSVFRIPNSIASPPVRVFLCASVANFPIK